jgi:hypothetical protein
MRQCEDRSCWPEDPDGKKTETMELVDTTIQIQQQLFLARFVYMGSNGHFGV